MVNKHPRSFHGKDLPPDVYCNHCEDPSKEKKFSKQEILDLLPKDMDFMKNPDDLDIGIRSGWNAYRQAVIDALEKARK